MNAIQKSISDLKYLIPKAILEAAFVEQSGFGMINHRSPVSIDYRIREEIVEARVMADVNLVSGQETTIPMANVVPEHFPLNRTVWRIPFDLTSNRKITKVYSLIIGTGYNSASLNTNMQGGGELSSAADGLLDSWKSIPNISNANIRLIGENTIMADQLYPSNPSLFLRCVLENDSEFNNLPAASVPKFSKLVELATKAYIYNTLILQIDSAQLEGGRELGRFLEIVDGYADSNEMYQEYLKDTWRRVAILSDTEAKRRHLKMIVGRR